MTAITPKIQYGRDTSGNAVLKVQTNKNVAFSNVGTVSGDAELRFGSTGDDNYTQITYQHTGDTDNYIVLSNTFNNNYNIVGENANVYSEGGFATRTVQVDAVNSNIDLSNADGSQFVYMSDASEKNKVQLGTGSDYYLDAGDFNHVVDNGGSNRFETTDKSFGSVIIGGGGSDLFMVGGMYGVLDGGDGNDTFEAVGMFGEDETSSYRNIMIGGDGDDKLIDKGGYNLFFGGNGNNSAEVSGTGTIAYLGSGSEEAGGTFGSSAIKNYIFTDENVTSASGKTYNLYEIMKQFKWSLSGFLNDTVTEEDTRSHLSMGSIDILTLAKLEEYFNESLE